MGPMGFSHQVNTTHVLLLLTRRVYTRISFGWGTTPCDAPATFTSRSHLPNGQGSCG
jgi:hypothetical protein